MMENAFINVKNRHYTITAPVELPDGNSNGVIISQGGRFGGWTLYMKDGKIHHEYNFFGVERTNIADTSTLSAGRHVIKYEFVPDAPRPGTGGNCMLFVDGKQAEPDKCHPKDRTTQKGDRDDEKNFAESLVGRGLAIDIDERRPSRQSGGGWSRIISAGQGQGL